MFVLRNNLVLSIVLNTMYKDFEKVNILLFEFQRHFTREKEVEIIIFVCLNFLFTI